MAPVIVELRPTGVAAGGDAVARDADGRVVFVAGGLPGERLGVRLTEERKDFARGEVLEVLDPSPHRVTPPCGSVAEGCGGCDWQHVDPAGQRLLKLQIVSDALRRIGKLPDPMVVDGPPLPAGGHRTTVRVAVKAGRLGFRRHQSHETVPVDDCLVAHPLLQDLLTSVEPGDATELTLRCGARTGERLVLASPTAEGVTAPDDVVVVGVDELRAGRRAWFTETIGGRSFRVSAGSFLQARPDGAEALVAAATTALADAPGGRFVDAYGGVGLFGGTTGQGRRVTLLEWSASSVADARVNLPEAKVLRIDVATWQPTAAAAVVADPARTGLGAKAAAVLARTGTTRLALVSCDPASLGRDAKLLADLGFRHDGSTVIDLFPHTSHVEVVSRFIRDGDQLRTVADG